MAHLHDPGPASLRNLVPFRLFSRIYRPTKLIDARILENFDGIRPGKDIILGAIL